LVTVVEPAVVGVSEPAGVAQLVKEDTVELATFLHADGNTREKNPNQPIIPVVFKNSRRDESI
jgi:hypothetical protein